MESRESNPNPTQNLPSDPENSSRNTESVIGNGVSLNDVVKPPVSQSPLLSANGSTNNSGNSLFNILAQMNADDLAAFFALGRASCRSNAELRAFIKLIFNTIVPEGERKNPGKTCWPAKVDNGGAAASGSDLEIPDKELSDWDGKNREDDTYSEEYSSTDEDEVALYEKEQLENKMALINQHVYIYVSLQQQLSIGVDDDLVRRHYLYRWKDINVVDQKVKSTPGFEATYLVLSIQSSTSAGVLMNREFMDILNDVSTSPSIVSFVLNGMRDLEKKAREVLAKEVLPSSILDTEFDRENGLGIQDPLQCMQMDMGNA